MPRLTSAQTELLDLIDTIVNDPAYYLGLDFEPGEMQFLKNAAILHARMEYEDWPEPAKKRHPLRLWLTNFSFEDAMDGCARVFERSGQPEDH